MIYYYTTMLNPLDCLENEKEVLRIRQEFIGEMVVQLGMSKEDFISEDDLASLDEWLDYRDPEDVARCAQEALKNIAAEAVIIAEDFNGECYGGSHRAVIVADGTDHIVRYYGWDELIARTKAEFHNSTTHMEVEDDCSVCEVEDNEE